MTDHHYTNRQDSPVFWVPLLPAVVFLIGGLASVPETVVVILCFSLSALMTFFAFAFTWLQTSDHGDHLLVSFGPLSILRRRVSYDRVRAVRRDRSRLIEGWGIRRGPRGWIWNIWGREVVELDLDKGRLRIGTDDPEGLLALLQDRCDLD